MILCFCLLLYSLTLFVYLFSINKQIEAYQLICYEVIIEGEMMGLNTFNSFRNHQEHVKYEGWKVSIRYSTGTVGTEKKEFDMIKAIIHYSSSGVLRSRAVRCLRLICGRATPCALQHEARAPAASCLLSARAAPRSDWSSAVHYNGLHEYIRTSGVFIVLHGSF